MSLYRAPRPQRARTANTPSRVAHPLGLRRPHRRRPRRQLRHGQPWNWTAIAAVLAAVASAAGVYFTGRSLEATRTQNAVTEQGQLTDRYGKAVDQLDRTGPEHLQARLGAIYALERLAHDSPRDQPTIIEVLSAFIRTTTPQPTPTPNPVPRPFRYTITICPQQAVAPDIQAALTVLGRRDATHDQTARVDLHNTCLTNVSLRGANLDDANLRAAVLTEADLTGANLTGADLIDANLTDAGLFTADLIGASLIHADWG